MARKLTGFVTAQAASISGLNGLMVDYLARTEVVIPSINAKPGRGRPRLYSFGDLVALRTVKVLLEAKVEVKNVKSCIAILQKKYGKTLTNCPGDFLFTDGKSIYLRSGKELVDDVSKGGQLVFLFMCDLRQIHAQTKQAERRIAEAG
jgi:hypothetical protein